jgi:hypothetical protein
MRSLVHVVETNLLIKSKNKMRGKKCEINSSKLLSYEKNPKVHKEKNQEKTNH